MERIAKFEKVSFPLFFSAMKDEFYKQYQIYHRYHSSAEKEFFTWVNTMYERLTLPRRSTVGSAGYDFKTPFQITLKPGESIKIPTGIRCRIEPGWFLMCAPRSGLGFKYRLRFANTIGIIDSDYYDSDNEGHIFAKLINEGDTALDIDAGTAFMQGIFLLYGITEDDDADGIRNGGFGSTSE